MKAKLEHTEYVGEVSCTTSLELTDIDPLIVDDLCYTFKSHFINIDEEAKSPVELRPVSGEIR